jgi:hypothetical protein
LKKAKLEKLRLYQEKMKGQKIEFVSTYEKRKRAKAEQLNLFE